MLLANKIAWDDTVLPFQLDRSDIRGRIARLDGILEKIIKQRKYPAPVEELISEAVVLTALIGQTMGPGWTLSLQIRGDGPIRIIATDYFGSLSSDEPAKMRAYASFDANRLNEASGAPFSMIGKGMFAILIDQGGSSKPYQGITPLAGGSLASCAETYFAQSEQLPTRFSIALDNANDHGKPAHWRAGGMMIQHMPKASPLMDDTTKSTGAQDDPAPFNEDKEENWRRVGFHLATLKKTELIDPQLSPTDHLVRLFHEERPRVFDAQPLEFGCTCGKEKVVQTLSAYSEKDIAEMTDSKGHVTADCQFCGAHYEIDPKELGVDAVRKPD